MTDINERSYSQIAIAEQSLVDLFRSVYFGRIENLHVKQGVPVSAPVPIVVRTLKLTEQLINRGHPGDYALKTEVVRCLDAIRELGTGLVRRIEVRHGLPILIELEQIPRFDRDDHGGEAHD